MTSFVQRVSRLGFAAAVCAPLLCSFFIGAIGRQAGSFFKQRQVDMGDQYFTTRLFLGHGRLWMFVLLTQAALALVVGLWINRSAKTAEWKLSALLALVVFSLSSVILVYLECQMAWAMHFMRAWDHALRS